LSGTKELENGASSGASYVRMTDHNCYFHSTSSSFVSIMFSLQRAPIGDQSEQRGIINKHHTLWGSYRTLIGPNMLFDDDVVIIACCLRCGNLTFIWNVKPRVRLCRGYKWSSLSSYCTK